MWPSCAAVVFAVAVAAIPMRAQTRLTDEEMRAAITDGQRYRSRQEYLEHGMSRGKVRFASAFAMDGMSKYVIFFSDYEVVAAAAAAANREMLPFGVEDARKLPLSGLLYALMEITGRGSANVGNVAVRYGSNRARVVLQVGGRIVQPLGIGQAANSGSSTQLPIALYSWYRVGHLSILTGGPLGWSTAKAEQEFVFQLTPNDLTQHCKAYLIDVNGNRIEKDVDLSLVATPSQVAYTGPTRAQEETPRSPLVETTALVPAPLESDNPDSEAVPAVPPVSQSIAVSSGVASEPTTTAATAVAVATASPDAVSKALPIAVQSPSAAGRLVAVVPSRGVATGPTSTGTDPVAATESIGAPSSESDAVGARAAFGAGRTYMGRHEWARAEHWFREAVRLDGSRAAYHAQLGKVLAIEERWPDAEAAFTAAVLLDVDNPEYRGLLKEARAR